MYNIVEDLKKAGEKALQQGLEAYGPYELQEEENYVMCKLTVVVSTCVLWYKINLEAFSILQKKFHYYNLIL